MIDFVRELTVFQWLLIAGGLFLIFPIVKDFFTQKEGSPNSPIKNVEDGNALTSTVHKWEVLYNACSDMGLVDAQAKLEEVFPMFAKLRNFNAKKELNKEQEQNSYE